MGNYIPKMAAILSHKKKIKEHLEEINDAISIGIELRPATIGFHASACTCELLELYLHKKELIDVGKIIKHDWFKRPKEGQKILPLIERKLPVNFDSKDEVYELIYTVEENRDNLIYGRSTLRQIELILATFNNLKGILIKKLEEEGEKIE